MTLFLDKFLDAYGIIFVTEQNKTTMVLTIWRYTKEKGIIHKKPVARDWFKGYVIARDMVHVGRESDLHFDYDYFRFD